MRGGGGLTQPNIMVNVTKVVNHVAKSTISQKKTMTSPFPCKTTKNTNYNFLNCDIAHETV